MIWIAVAAGGALGSVARHSVNVVLSPSCASMVHGKASGIPGKAVTGFQVNSIQGLCALRRSTTTPIAILAGAGALMRLPRDER